MQDSRGDLKVEVVSLDKFRLEVMMKMNIKDTYCMHVGSVSLLRDMDQGRALTNT